MPKDTIKIDPNKGRPNTKLYTSPSDPLYTASTSVNNPASPSVISSIPVSYAKNGQYYNANTSAAAIAKGSSLILQLTLPASWSKTMYVDRIRGGSDNTATINVYQAAVTIATTVAVVNTNLTVSNKSSNVQAGALTPSTDPLTGIPVFAFVTGSGTTDIDLGGRVIISNTATTVQNYCFKITNTSATSSSANCLISVGWWEV